MIAHEAVGRNRQRRRLRQHHAGAAAQRIGRALQSSAAVRARCAADRAHIAPEILDGYMRYYLRSVNRQVGSNLRTTFISTFGLPDTIRDALVRQLDVVLGGI